MNDPHPKKVGKYEIRAPLGRGAVGSVYQGYQADLDRHVAIKLMIAGEHASEALIRRFMREARAAASLVHPGIVQIHDLGAQGSLHYIVMEWVEGGSLADLLPSGPLAPREAVRIAIPVLDALAAAHEKGIVHRDIKPSNLLLDGKGNPKIADFGLALSLEDGDRLTRTGDILGTPRYMSPEQAFGSPEEVDARADLYAVGAVLYELLTGRAPFEGSNAFSILKRIELEEPAPPSARVPGLSPALDAVVLRALEKDPARRFSSAAEFAAALRGALDGRGIPRPREGGGRRMAWRAAAAAGALLMALALFILPGSAQPPAEPVRPLLDGLPHLLSAGPARDRELLRAIDDLEAHLARHPSDGGAADGLSRALLAAGSARRSVEAASRALANGHDTAAARLHRLFALFVRRAVIEGNSRIPYLSSRPELDPSAELRRMGALGASAAEAALAEAIQLSFQGRFGEAEERARGLQDPRAAVVRRHALLRLPGGSCAASGSPALRLPEALLSALEAARRGDPAEATRRADALLAAAPRPSSDLSVARAVALEHLDRFERVQEALRVAASADPEDPFPTLYRLAVALFLQADLETDPDRTAAEVLDRLGPLASGGSREPGLHVALGVAHAIQGNRKMSETSFAAARSRASEAARPGGLPAGFRPANLELLVAAAGASEAAFLLQVGHLLFQFKRPGAEAAIREALERSAGAEPEVRQQAHLLLASNCLPRNSEQAVGHLRAALEAGLDPSVLAREPRFGALLEDARHRKALTGQDDASRKARVRDGGRSAEARGDAGVRD